MEEKVDEFSRSLREVLSLRADQAHPGTIDAAIRDGAQIGGTNLWVLMCAIVIASVGLNVNSTAVIIGAMLISPLMGPIIGAGYGAGVHDHALMRQSLRNLGVFVAISLAASTAYFLVTPLGEAHSELLARTSPTIWDVAIAFFGGAAGMVGLTRRGPTTVIPGVAIATALMPPLCTAGYGIATGQPEFFLGAAYLFVINCVFIGFATLAITRMLRLPRRALPDPEARRRARIAISTIVLLTLVPSIWLASKLVRQEVFRATADRVISELGEDDQDIAVLSRRIDPRTRHVSISVIGRDATPDLGERLARRLDGMGLDGATVTVKRVDADGIDLGALRNELGSKAMQDAITAVEARSARVVELERELDALKDSIAELARVEAEIHAQLPELRRVIVTGSVRDVDGAGREVHVLVALVDVGDASAEDLDRLQRWLRARLPRADVEIVVGRELGAGSPAVL